MEKRKKEALTRRREFLARTLQGTGLAAMGGLVWGGYVGVAKTSPLVLRPPAALPEKEFLAGCIKCGLCVEACPYTALKLARPGDPHPLGTPYFVPRERPCYMCEDIPCVPACPTGVLDPSRVSEKDGNGKDAFNINLARMGLAVIDRETCIAYWGIQCDACHRACPLLDKAITVETSRNERTGHHAFLAPMVHSDFCTGCGLCERACVTEKASIFVLPRELVMGKATQRYVRGWDTRDEERLQGISTDVTTETKASEKKAMDYLNEDDLLTEE